MVVAAADMMGVVFDASESLRWRFAGTDVGSATMGCSGSSRSRLSVLILCDWRLPDNGVRVDFVK